MLNIKKFKNQSKSNLITPITNHFQANWSNIKELCNALHQLQTSVQDLRNSSKEVEEYITSVNRLVNQWQFKNQPRLEKIQQILNKMN
jgi:ABC-type transporter Mla subunit MlaD